MLTPAWQKSVRRSVQVVRAQLGSKPAGAVGSGLELTEAAEDDNGNTITRRWFILGVDALGDAGAAVVVRGNGRDYGR